MEEIGHMMDFLEEADNGETEYNDVSDILEAQIEKERKEHENGPLFANIDANDPRDVFNEKNVIDGFQRTYIVGKTRLNVYAYALLLRINDIPELPTCEVPDKYVPVWNCFIDMRSFSLFSYQLPWKWGTYDVRLTCSMYGLQGKTQKGFRGIDFSLIGGYATCAGEVATALYKIDLARYVQVLQLHIIKTVNGQDQARTCYLTYEARELCYLDKGFPVLGPLFVDLENKDEKELYYCIHAWNTTLITESDNYKDMHGLDGDTWFCIADWNMYIYTPNAGIYLIDEVVNNLMMCRDKKRFIDSDAMAIIQFTDKSKSSIYYDGLIHIGFESEERNVTHLYGINFTGAVSRGIGKLIPHSLKELRQFQRIYENAKNGNGKDYPPKVSLKDVVNKNRIMFPKLRTEARYRGLVVCEVNLLIFLSLYAIKVDDYYYLIYDKVFTKKGIIKPSAATLWYLSFLSSAWPPVNSKT